MKYLIFFFILIAGCQPTVTQKKTSPETAASGLGVIALMDLDLHYVIMSNVNGSWNVSLENAPSWLSVQIEGSNVVLKGIPQIAQASFTNIKLIAQFQDKTTETLFNLEVRGDILRPFQWHLQNNGQSFFSREEGLEGQDMKVIEAWRLGAMGEGVRIAVSDSGLEIGHEDLGANMLLGEHRNYNTGTLGNNFLGNPTPGSERHGTAVSGIIGAVGWNNRGTTGVAPQSKIAGFNYVDSSFTTEMTLNQASGDFDIFNYSYSTDNLEDYEDDFVYLAQLRDQVTNAKQGRGRVFVKSAGNEYFSFCLASGECPPQNANIPLDNNSPYIIVTSATDAKGFATSYSNAGSNIWVAAPGGEDGNVNPAIVTTDLSGCSLGSSVAARFDSFNTFEAFSTTESVFKTFNPNCDYSSMMNGTSAATPNTVGVIALMLSEFSQLSWREVKHILALTTDRVHSSSVSTVHPYQSMRLDGHIYEQGWVQNAAGHFFHNWYGFGQVNAKKAVEMTRQMKEGTIARLPAIWSETDVDFTTKVVDATLPKTITDGAAGITSTTTLALGGMVVESVQINLQVTHPRSGQVGVELTSPSGTKSILLNINNALLVPRGGVSDSDLDVTLTSHAFYGEDATGTWTLKLVDGKADEFNGSLDQWSINILGH